MRLLTCQDVDCSSSRCSVEPVSLEASTIRYVKEADTDVTDTRNGEEV